MQVEVRAGPGGVDGAMYAGGRENVFEQEEFSRADVWRLYSGVKASLKMEQVFLVES